MKKTCMWCLLVLVSMVSVGWSQTGGAEKAVAAQEQVWLQSQKTNNPDLVAPLLSDKIVVTLADGTVHDKAGILASAKKTKYDSVDYTDVKVRVFGNMAIATGGFDATGTDEAGKPFEAHERWTDTWLRIPSGKWLCVASADVPIKK
jgi:ketosteroid isomerase-like protein